MNIVRKGHLYKKFHITLVAQKTDDGKWLCRAKVDGTKWEWKPHDEIDDVKGTAMKKALDKAKEEIDRAMRFCKRLGVELIS
jgi:hypothetical protein